MKVKRRTHSQPTVHSAYVGLNGSGKTYSVVANVIVPALERGRVIATNLRFKDELYDRFPHAEIIQIEESDVYDLENDKPKPEGLLSEKFETADMFVLDECQTFIPADLSTPKLHPDFRKFLTKLRHRKVNGRSSLAVYICPDLGQVAKFIRELIKTTYRTIKMDSVGLAMVYHVQVWEGAITGQRPAGKPSKNMKGIYKQEIYDLYYSQTGVSDEDFEDIEDDFEYALEETLDNRNNLIKKQIIRILFGIVLAIFAFKYVYSELSSEGAFHSSLSKNESEIDESDTTNKLKDKKNIGNETNQSYLADSPLSSNSAEAYRYYIVASYSSSNHTVLYTIETPNGNQYNSIELRNFGYKIEPIGKCFANISHGNETIIAMCKPDNLLISESEPT